MTRAIRDRGRGLRTTLFVWLLVTLAGCGREPSQRELENAKAFEALLTAVSLKNEKELEMDAKVIDERHKAGELSDAKYKELQEIVEKARARTGKAPRSVRMSSVSSSAIAVPTSTDPAAASICRNAPRALPGLICGAPSGQEQESRNIKKRQRGGVRTA